jgi:hypothetical protein
MICLSIIFVNAKKIAIAMTIIQMLHLYNLIYIIILTTTHPPYAKKVVSKNINNG